MYLDWATGEQSWPCRCGQIHRGSSGRVLYQEHNCFHTPPLVRFGDEYGYVVCGECGTSWNVELS